MVVMGFEGRNVGMAVFGLVTIMSQPLSTQRHSQILNARPEPTITINTKDLKLC